MVLVLRHYYMCSIVCKSAIQIFNTRLYSIRSWYRLWRSASIDLWCRRQSRYSINGMDRDCRSRICIILANASYAFSVYFDHWCIHKMKVSEKLGKISATVLTSLLGTTAIAALIGIGSTMLFGLQGAKFTRSCRNSTNL